LGGWLDRAVDGEGLYMKGPMKWEALKKFESSQIPDTLGAGTETEIYLGDFSKVLIGVRTNLTVEISRQANTAAGEGFSKLQGLIRVYARYDVACEQAQHLCKLTGYSIA
jgi:HK97 family phage major capsid protein